MRLSKVKRVALSEGDLFIAQADTGIDVRTWIGAGQAMYPVHELYMTPNLAARIWELDEKQINTLRISQGDDSNQSLIIPPSVLMQLPAMAEAENGEPNMERICQIDEMIILIDNKTSEGFCFNVKYLAPVEGSRIQYFRLEGSKVIGVYSDGKLEAAIYALKWGQLEHLSKKIDAISTAWVQEGI